MSDKKFKRIILGWMVVGAIIAATWFLIVNPYIPITLNPPSAKPTQTKFPTARPRRLRPGEMELVADSNSFPTILVTEASFISVQASNQELAEEEFVIGLEIEGDARAYPVKLLSIYEIINDRVGGRPVAITWCPLCFTAIVFDRTVDKELVFSVSGYLFHDNLVMYDLGTKTYWSQILGEAIRGAYRGTRLEVLPSQFTTWKAWKEAYPGTVVLSAEYLGLKQDQVIDPYAAYYQSGALGLSGEERMDQRQAPKSLVIGVQIGELARAYPLEYVAEQQVIDDALNEVPLVLVYNSETTSTFAYSRMISGRVLTFTFDEINGVLRDRETETLWDPISGQGLDGELSSERLTRLNATMMYWFAWIGIYSDTEIYQP